MPRHFRNIAIAALLALLALTAGINGYTHHQIKTKIDSAINSIRPVALVKYSDLSASLLTGKIKFENVRVAVKFLPEAFNLGNVTLETPGLSYMLNAPDKIEKGEFPKQLEFVINDFNFDLHSKTADWLDRLVNNIQPIYSRTRKLCDGKSIFSPSDFKKMGYNRLSSRLRLAYDFKEKDKALNFHISAGIGNIGNIKADINMANVSSNKIMHVELAQLTKAEIIYTDQGYAERAIKYCSTLSNMEQAAYINAEAQQPDKYFYTLWGFAPGKGLREAYKDFLFKPNLVTLTMAPSKEFNPGILSTMSHDEISINSADVMSSLNAHLKINGLAINDLRFKLPSPEFNHLIDRRFTKALDVKSLLRGEEIKAPIKKDKTYIKAPAKYHRIRISQVRRHVDNYILITTKSGNKRKGRLIRMDRKNLYVEQRFSTGKFTMTVPRSRIKTIEAYFSK